MGNGWGKGWHQPGNGAFGKAIALSSAQKACTGGDRRRCGWWI